MLATSLDISMQFNPRHPAGAVLYWETPAPGG